MTRASRPTEVCPRTAIGVFAGALAMMLSVMVISLFFTLPDNVLTSRSEGAASARLLFATAMPQNWGFFTNPPQDVELGVYDTKTMESALLTPQTRSENRHGLTRAQRAQGPELALLAGEVEEWSTCASPTNIRACLAEPDGGTSELVNGARHRSVCGDYLLTREKPIPFEYRHFYKQTHSIESYAKVRVECD